jgi:hypothetical protein
VPPKAPVKLSPQQAKDAVVEAVSRGATVAAALDAVGRSMKTHENWRSTDKEYAGRLDEVRAIRKAAGDKGAMVNELSLSFAEWRLKYLKRETYPHMQNLIDVVEGRDPSWLHPAMTWEPRRRNRTIINIPPFHAKSQTLTVDYVTYRLCQNPNFRVVIISKRQEQAKKFLGQIRQRLTSNLFTALQVAFGGPEGFRGEGTVWRQNMLYLAGRDSDAADASIEALGLGGQIYGTRSDLILLDDCVVGSNANEFEKQINWMESEVENRVFDGSIVVIGTRLAPQDLYSELRNGDRYLSGKSPWSYLRMPMVLEYGEKAEDWKTLWPETTIPMDENDAKPKANGLYAAWDGIRASQTRDSKPPKTWNLVYQQADQAEDAVFDPKCVMGSVDRRRKPGILKAGAWGHPRNGMEGQYVIASMDPAMTGDTFTLVGTVDRKDNMRRVMNAWVETSPTPAYIRNLIEDVTDQYQVNEWVIEKNAFQLFLIHDEAIQLFCRSRGVRITEHYTSRNKQDPDFGVASLAPLFGTLHRIHDGAGRADHQGDNLIQLPDPDMSQGIKTLIEELVAWQPGKLGKQLRMDGPMALWFFELRAREILGQSRQRTQHFMNNPYLSRADQQRRVVLPLNDFRERQSG